MDRTSAPGWEAVAAASLDGVGLVRDGAYVRGNDRLAAVYGFEDPEELRGADWTDLHEFEHPVDAGEVESSSLGRVTVRDESRAAPDPSSDEAPPIDAEDVIQRARATGSWRGSGRVHRQDGGTAPALLSLRTADEGLVVVVRALAGERDVPDAPGSAGRAGQAEPTGRSGPDDPPERPPTVTELEFRVIDRASLLVALSDDLDCTLTLAGSVPADGGWLLYLDLRAPPERPRSTPPASSTGTPGSSSTRGPTGGSRWPPRGRRCSRRRGQGAGPYSPPRRRPGPSASS
jgi:hypothetical protein